MRRRRILQIALLAAVALLPAGIWLWSTTGMVEYQPVVQKWAKGEPFLDKSPSLATPEHLDRMERVLTTYQEPFRRASRTKLLIPVELSRDVDLLWNYTSKAEDPEWLAQQTASQSQPSSAFGD